MCNNWYKDYWELADDRRLVTLQRWVRKASKTKEQYSKICRVQMLISDCKINLNWLSTHRNISDLSS